MPDQDGRAVWREVAKSGDALLLHTDSLEIGARLERRIVNKDLPFGGKWVYEFTASDQGCKLTITEFGEVYNPIFRFIGHFFLDPSATIRRYLKQLERHLDQ